MSVAVCVLMGCWMMAKVAVWWRRSVLASTTRTYILLGRRSNWIVTTLGELAQSGCTGGTGLALRGYKVVPTPLMKQVLCLPLVLEVTFRPI